MSEDLHEYLRPDSGRERQGKGESQLAGVPTLRQEPLFFGYLRPGLVTDRPKKLNVSGCLRPGLVTGQSEEVEPCTGHRAAFAQGQVTRSPEEGAPLPHLEGGSCT